MEQPVRSILPAALVVQYDVAALQVKLMTLALVVDDLQKRVEEQAQEITALQERFLWLNK